VDASGNVYYEFADMLGSTRVVTDSTGNTCFDADYYPYGQKMDHTSTCAPTSRFTGYEYDVETGNYYAFFRYYSPRLGRFMTADPLGGSMGNPQSLNRYSYVVNNPANFVDPLGLKNIMDYDELQGGGWLFIALVSTPARSRRRLCAAGLTSRPLPCGPG
jgi:RHS repeat-associated protein